MRQIHGVVVVFFFGIGCAQAKPSSTDRKPSPATKAACVGVGKGDEVDRVTKARNALQNAMGKNAEVGIGMTNGKKVLKVRSVADLPLTGAPDSCQGFPVEVKNINK